ncbi:GH36-type glycosyl hydrolase domain-containing protein [Anoxybacter fermentans]|nr:glycosyl transferase family 36 [Anoxybacter fermentans]
MTVFQNKYGYFDEEGKEYVITRPDTPRPWVNVICPGDYGLVISQTGGGYSWKTHASLNRITRWEQDLIRDDWGKYVYLRDDNTGYFWSLTWKPVCQNPEFYQVHHGIGYSKFISRNYGIRSQLTIFIPKDDPVEIWWVELTNESNQEKTLSLFTYLEWGLGVAPDSHREFHKIFIETEFDGKLNTLLSRKRFWELPNEKGQHWNRDWEYVAFHSVNEPVVSFEGDKENFLGMYGSLQAPAAIKKGRLTNSCGKWGDAIGSLHNQVKISPGESIQLVYLLGAVKKEEMTRLEELILKYQNLKTVEKAFTEVKRFWNQLLSTLEVKTPDVGFNLMNNVWLKYQAISGRIWGRTGYYQAGGAYGFRDQLQDSQIFLLIDPDKTAEQIKLHAAHQFPEGRVNHWWHPLSEIGAENNISDNLLWLPFVTIKYLKETGNFDFLDEKVPYKNGEEATIYQHCCQAIEYSLSKRSKRGLPLIGDGDWNDGMNAVGFAGKGESIWLGHFLYGILKDFTIVAEKYDDVNRAARYRKEAKNLKKAINDYGWNGEWYIRAVCDDGYVMGSKECKEGKIFLNAQTWAILNDVADEERAKKVFRSVEKYLIREYGPILFYPAYKKPYPNIGYLSRYAPGVRENGGLYTHAATWAVLAACKLGYGEKAYRILKSFLPPYRGQNPDLYKVEPYVTPGNVDGPDSPNFGRGGWSWYTGSAAWTFLVAIEGILGIKAEWDGLRIEPAIPTEWEEFFVSRQYRGATYQIYFKKIQKEEAGIYIDGERLKGNVIFPHGDGKIHKVEVFFK